MPFFVYAAKFLCGDFDPKLISEREHIEGPVKPGNYATAINVHNPNLRPVVVQKKAVLLFAGLEPAREEQFEKVWGPPLKPGPRRVELPPDGGVEIDCPDIRQVLLEGDPRPHKAPIFVKGWVVLTSPLPLDVVAVYTAHTFDAQGQSEGFALDVDRVQPTQVAGLLQRARGRTTRGAKRKR